MGSRGNLPADLVGKKFTKLTVIKRSDKMRGKSFLWECACDCGGINYVTTDQLNRGRTRSCGCLRKEVKGTLSNTSKWVDKAVEVHGELYDYSLSIYTRAIDPIQIICKIHGEFTQKASDHTNCGAGCPKCSLGGFSSNSSGFFYILKAGDFTKVGITNKEVNHRVKELNRKSGYEFEIINTYYFEDGKFCTELESNILKYLRALYKTPEIKFSGYSECFKDVNYKNLILEVENLMEKNNEKA